MEYKFEYIVRKQYFNLKCFTQNAPGSNKNVYFSISCPH